MSDEKFDQWKALAAKESRGADLSRATLEGITLKTVYGPDDAAHIDSIHIQKPEEENA